MTSAAAAYDDAWRALQSVGWAALTNAARAKIEAAKECLEAAYEADGEPGKVEP